jgi:N-methylhydantoinase B
VTDTGLDAITYEVVRNRMIAITEEMRVALQNVSGSPTVTEASDFFTGLFLPDGTGVSMGFQVSFGGSAVATLIRHLLERPTPIADGDMFIANDPYIGALHQNDVQMCAPLFHDGELVAWAGVMAHETDVGGMDFASWCPGAREVYQEGLRVPGVKLVDRGEVRDDVMSMILTASRLPAALGLDLRAFIATLNVARDRVGVVAARYGNPTMLASMERMVAGSEARLRHRLRELPDATVRARDFLEHDGHEDRLYEIDVVLTKRGDSLRLDFGVSSPQAPGFVNCTRAGLHGGVMGALLPTLAFDIPWNEGLMAVVDIEAPDGLVCTALHPAPVGAATVEAVWVVCNAVASALNKLLGCSPSYAHRAQAGSAGAMATFNMGGRNQFGEWFGLHLMDPLAAGMGAFSTRDGIHAGGPIQGPMPAIPDVEVNERAAPLLYLHRRLATDSGGPGARRGGLGGEAAFTVYGVDEVDALIMTHGAEVPNSAGLFGGLPGAQIRQRMGRAVLEPGAHPLGGRPHDPAELGGAWEDLGPKPGMLPMAAGDVVAVSWQGGGGVGDPLDRDADAVWRDVADGLVSDAQARRVYGVAAGAAGVDAGATAQLRSELRAARIGPTHGSHDGGPPADGWPVGPSLRLHRGGAGWELRSGDEVLAVDGTAWRARAISREIAWPRLHPELALTAHYCPASARLLAVDVHRRGAVPQDDIELDLSSVEALLSRVEEREAGPFVGRLTARRSAAQTRATPRSRHR